MSRQPPAAGQKTELHFACCRGDPKLIIEAVKQGISINALDDKQCSPLHVAARYNHTEVCRFLMSQGADMSLQDSAGRTPAQVTKSPEVKAFFAEAVTNPAVYMRIPGDGGAPRMSAADAPFVDAAVEEQVVLFFGGWSFECRGALKSFNVLFILHGVIGLVSRGRKTGGLQSLPPTPVRIRKCCARRD